MAQRRILQDSHTSQNSSSFRFASQTQLDHRPPRLLTPDPVSLHRPPLEDSEEFGVGILCRIRPRVCWLASAPPSGRAWRLTSRWSCCCWRCGCGCWGPRCRIGTLWSWRCCEVLLRWRERAAEKKKSRVLVRNQSHSDSAGSDIFTFLSQTIFIFAKFPKLPKVGRMFQTWNRFELQITRPTNFTIQMSSSLFSACYSSFSFCSSSFSFCFSLIFLFLFLPLIFIVPLFSFFSSTFSSPSSSSWFSS